MENHISGPTRASAKPDFLSRFGVQSKRMLTLGVSAGHLVDFLEKTALSHCVWTFSGVRIGQIGDGRAKVHRAGLAL
jgi:hypothetical protein